jgi:hypothetical protein
VCCQVSATSWSLVQEFYRQWCVVVCDLENLKNEEAMIRVGTQRHKKIIS